jgi:hypothetical protein
MRIPDAIIAANENILMFFIQIWQVRLRLPICALEIRNVCGTPLDVKRALRTHRLQYL